MIEPANKKITDLFPRRYASTRSISKQMKRKPSSKIESDGVKCHLISSFFTPHALNDFPFHGTDQGEDGTDGLNPSAGRIDQDTVFSAPFFLVT